jgi:hypothetical protein
MSNSPATHDGNGCCWQVKQSVEDIRSERVERIAGDQRCHDRIDKIEPSVRQALDEQDDRMTKKIDRHTDQITGLRIWTAVWSSGAALVVVIVTLVIKLYEMSLHGH